MQVLNLVTCLNVYLGKIQFDMSLVRNLGTSTEKNNLRGMFSILIFLSTFLAFLAMTVFLSLWVRITK